MSVKAFELLAAFVSGIYTAVGFMQGDMTDKVIILVVVITLFVVWLIVNFRERQQNDSEWKTDD